MRKSFFKILLIFCAILLIYTSCNSQKKLYDKGTVLSDKDKVKLIKLELELTESEIRKINESDSILDQVVLSIRKPLSKDLIKKHLDPFIKGKYNTKTTYILLRLQTRYKEAGIELASKEESKGFRNFETIKEAEAFFDKMDSIFSKVIVMEKIETIKLDSTQKKKQ